VAVSDENSLDSTIDGSIAGEDDTDKAAVMLDESNSRQAPSRRSSRKVNRTNSFDTAAFQSISAHGKNRGVGRSKSFETCAVPTLLSTSNDESFAAEDDTCEFLEKASTDKAAAMLDESNSRKTPPPRSKLVSCAKSFDTAQPSISAQGRN
jgi:hypothetical protein